MGNFTEKEKVVMVIGGILLSPFVFAVWVLEKIGILKANTHEYPEINVPIKGEEDAKKKSK